MGRSPPCCVQCHALPPRKPTCEVSISMLNPRACHGDRAAAICWPHDERRTRAAFRDDQTAMTTGAAAPPAARLRDRSIKAQCDRLLPASSSTASAKCRIVVARSAYSCLHSNTPLTKHDALSNRSSATEREARFVCFSVAAPGCGLRRPGQTPPQSRQMLFFGGA